LDKKVIFNNVLLGEALVMQ